ncbi:biopolymer transporter ExbD [Candidatus Binatia bacterium]|nr:biopolymer transporter ExbD [Candidatus Binatia bacterium]
MPEHDGGDGEGIVAEINITPLTDIFLVLLIIFMITSSAMVESGPKVDLPEAGVTSSETKGIVVTVDQQDNIFVNGAQTPRDQLAAGLRQAVEASDVKRVVLQGDKGVQLGDVVYILDEARAAGAAEVAIAATRRE